MARLRIGDLKDLDGPLPYVALRGTKSAAARREVPIAKDALPIILRRSVGKAAGDYLLHELPTPTRGPLWKRDRN